MATSSSRTGCRRGLSRRRFLRATGVALSLPWLEAMRHARTLAAESVAPTTPRRMLAICNNLGVLAEPFFPQGDGENYTLSPYLELLKKHRRDFTVFSGVSHPNVDGGHPSDISFLTAAPHPASSSFRNTISLDQFVAERIGVLTRFPSLTLAVNTGSRSLSWTGTGGTWCLIAVRTTHCPTYSCPCCNEWASRKKHSHRPPVR